jgi:Ca2+/H+ antiporter, TMEM165/GDT1 family
MMCFGNERGKKFWIKRAIFIPIAIVAGVSIFGTLTMYLWNEILPGVLGVHTITFWQAIGILILSKIIFSGFHGGHGRHGFHRKHALELREKWLQMTPEEREKMKADLKAEWKSRFDRPARQE